MKRLILLFFVLAVLSPALKAQEYHLVWSDEFDYEGAPDSARWTFEQGFERNEELQWYQPDNACCHNGILTIEGRMEHKANPQYIPGSKSWKTSREFIDYTSSSITTKGKMSFTYGRVEVRARIPVGKGAWPAIWLLGTAGGWPGCGEIDIMEFYRYQGVPSVLANACWAAEKPWEQRWITRAYPLTDWTDDYPEWPTEFHVWRFDWDEDFIRIYLDDKLLNETDLRGTINEGGRAKGVNPFHHPMYLLLNLAIGGTGGREPKAEAYPLRYDIDYVRVYSKD